MKRTRRRAKVKAKIDFVAQPTNRSMLHFEAQTKKPSRWFWGANHQTRDAGFEVQTGNPPPPWFWGSTKKPTASFEAKLGETVATSFEAKLEKTVATGFEAKPEKTVAAGFEAKPPETIATGFEAKPLETVAAGFEAKPLETVITGFEAKPAKTVRVVLMPNHLQTVAIGFKAQTDEKPFEWFWG
jgi:hypothetical protein